MATSRNQVAAEALDALPSGVMLVNDANQVTYVNPALAKFLHAGARDWTTCALEDVASHMETELACFEARSYFQSWTANPAEMNVRELRLQSTGEPMYLREDSAPVRDCSNAVIGRVFLYHDISREKAIDRMKTEFIGVASHELRTPMTSIKGAIDLVLSGFAGNVSSDIRELLSIGQKNCERLVRLVNEILDLSKIEAGQIQLKLEAVDPFIPVEDTLRALRPVAEQHSIRLVLERSSECAKVTLDKDRIVQVMTNLVSNAIKFSPPNSEVRVRLECEGEFLRCSVADKGIGIAEHDLPRVFGKFQQLGDAPRKDGTGLGLAIARALVLEHGGQIWVESRLRAGTCFTFRLPVHGPERAQNPSALVPSSA